MPEIQLENPAEIENIVGAKRHPTKHLGRLDSDTGTIYILHSAQCVKTFPDLRDCRYSHALERSLWPWREDARDRPVVLAIVTHGDDDAGLVPAGNPPKRWRGKAPAEIHTSDFTPGVWVWRCRLVRGYNEHAFTGHGSAPDHASALAALTQHQRERHPGPTFVALAAAHIRRMDTAYRVISDSGLVPALNDAGIDMLEAARLLAQDPAALAAVRELAREMKGGEPG